MRSLDEHAEDISFVIGNWVTPMRPDRPWRWFAYVGNKQKHLKAITFEELLKLIREELESR